MNVYQGIPDGSTVTAGQTIEVRFDRKPTGLCPNPLNQYPGEDYSVWLYNNPVRDRDNLSFDHSVKITGGINEQTGLVDITIPNDLPDVQDGSVWYLRVSTTLVTAPQVSFLHFFTIVFNGASGLVLSYCRY